MKKFLLSFMAIAVSMAVMAQAPAFVQFDNQSEMETAAQTWFTTNVTEGQVIPPADVATLDVTETPSLWVMIDRDGLAVGEANLPVSADFKTALEGYVKRGGNLLLTNHATQLVNSIGRCTYAPGIFGSGAGGHNPDVWGVQAVIGNVEGQIYDHRSHAIFNGMEENNAYGHPTFALIGSGNKKDHNCMWDLNSYGFPQNPNVVEAFEAATNSVVLGTWQHVVDYCCAGIVEFLPDGEYTGTVLAVGLAAFDWQAPQSGTNMSLMAANAVSYLTPSTPTDVETIERAKANVVIENGQVVILKDGIRYNLLGVAL